MLGSGPKRGELDPAEAAHIDKILDDRDRIELGTYDKKFATAWSDVRKELATSIVSSGWWRRLPPGATAQLGNARAVGMLVAILAPDLLRRRIVHHRPARAVRQRRPRRRVRDRRAGDLRLLPVPPVAARPQRDRIGIGVADRVVPPVPRGERRPARRLGVEARPAPRVQRVGGGARRRGCVEQGAQQEPRATRRGGRAEPSDADLLDGFVDLEQPHRTVELGFGLERRSSFSGGSVGGGGGGGSSGSW